SRLWGLELNGLAKVLDRESFRLVGLLGFRYVNLQESLDLTDSFSDAATGGSFIVADSFQTDNQFYGAQVGTRATYVRGKFSGALTAKLAVGADVGRTSIDGSSTVTRGAFGFLNGVYPGGIFAQPSNIGEFSQTRFCVIPEAELVLGYAVTEHVRAQVGYN